MKLLIFTQKVDRTDSVLGFFHTWITEMSKKVESITVICLFKGEFNFPKNVTVYSLGKERNVSRLSIIKNLYYHLFLIRGSYGKVFVHMNQEYILLAGIYWKLVGVPVYMWRNHGSGNFLTLLAVTLCTKVFCTSKQSFTAQFKKTVIMPVGVDTEIFKLVKNIVRKKYSMCMVGRISPFKHIDKALSAVNHLILSGQQISFSIIGPISDKDFGYYQKLKEFVANNKLSTSVVFINAVSPDKLPEIYSSHETCINLSEFGMFDKTILESAACGTIPLVSNSTLAYVPKESCIPSDSIEDISNSIKMVMEARYQIEIQDKLKSFVNYHSLKVLMEKLFLEMK